MQKIIIFTAIFIFLNCELHSQYTWNLQSLNSPPKYIYTTPGGKIYLMCQNYIIYSSNNGLSWTHPTLLSSSYVLAYYCIDSLTWFRSDNANNQYSTYSNIYKTTNSGNTWVLKNNGIQETASAIFFVNQSTGWMVGDKISKTTNEGVTWNSQLTPIDRLTSIHMLNLNTGFATSLVDSFYVTTNGGSNWMPRSSGSGQFLTKVSFINNTTGFILCDPAKFMKTTDGGNNWSSSNFSFTGNARTFDFVNANTGWTGDYYGSIYKTTNGAVNWTRQRNPIDQYYGIEVIKSIGENYCYMGQNDGRFIRTSNGGTNWTYLFSNPLGNLASIAFVNSNTGFIFTTSNTIWKTTNRGTKWLINTNPGAAINCSYADSINGCYIGSNSGNVFNSTDFGNTWNQSTIGTSNIASIKYYNNNGWICGSGGNVFKTTNHGGNWIQLQTNITTDLYSQHFINDNTGWIIGAGGRILKTTNSDMTFDSSKINSNLKGVYFKNENTGYVISNYSVRINFLSYEFHRNIAKSTNGGINWTTVYDYGIQTGATFNSPDFTSLAFADSLNGFATTLDGKIVSTSNGGNTWSESFSTFINSFNYVYFKNTRSGWVVGNNGFILFEGDALIGINNNEHNVPKNYELSQNYPNPFNPSTKINFVLAKTGFVTLKVYDILGREVRTLVNEMKQAGNYAVDFNASEFSSGVFFYRIEANGFSAIKKMMLIK